LSLPEFQLLRPRTVEDAVSHLARHAGKIQVVAGGTDLIPSMRQRLFTPEYLLDIRGIASLRGVRPPMVVWKLAPSRRFPPSSGTMRSVAITRF
jgi:hypothetical protein